MPTNLQPWRAEVELTVATVGQILERQFPSLNPQTIRYHSEGWDSWVFLVDNTWVFRFPKRREVETHLPRETRLLDALAGQLPLPIPQVTWRGAPSEPFPFHFIGYRLIPGAPGDKTEAPCHARGLCARQLGGFLRALHAFSLERASLLGFPAEPRDPPAVVLLTETLSLAERIEPYVPADLRERCRPFLRGEVNLPEPCQGPYRLIHGDLQAEHVLLDPNGSIAGVIDFGDAGVGDPAGDFAGPYVWQDPDFARAVLDAYGGAPDAGFFDRITFLARCLSLSGIGWVDKNDSVQLSVFTRFLRNAFAAEPRAQA